ncbi:MAG TPA: enoyl-CoA hydratase-related protein [Planctomycetota bacterium]|nr:enoyl-CoA hydratase-related protein [Planctomycetota bacterium]
MAYENILRADRDGIAFVTINRPDKLNALNNATIGELLHCFEAITSDEKVRAVILTGAGEKSFVAGADISELAEQTAISARPLALRGQRLMNTVESCTKPVVAAVNGYALGGGCELALACHIRTASDNAQFGLPEVTLGIIPGYGGTQRLPRIVGKGRALELILSAQKVGAEEALRIGLVNRVHPQAQLLAETEKLVRRILATGPVAVRFALDAVNHGSDMPLQDGLNFEATFFGLLAGTDDCREGMRAFLEKRPARFTGK